VKRCVDSDYGCDGNDERAAGWSPKDPRHREGHEHPEKGIASQKRGFGNCETREFRSTRSEPTPVFLRDMGEVSCRKQEDPRAQKGRGACFRSVRRGFTSRSAA
jgi:hypothetical protein